MGRLVQVNGIASHYLPISSEQAARLPAAMGHE
jgi:hypothetical protein